MVTGNIYSLYCIKELVKIKQHKKHQILIIHFNSMEVISLKMNETKRIKLKLVSFFVSRYLTVSLRGPVLTLRRGALRRVVTGWTGWMVIKSVL